MWSAKVWTYEYVARAAERNQLTLDERRLLALAYDVLQRDMYRRGVFTPAVVALNAGTVRRCVGGGPVPVGALLESLHARGWIAGGSLVPDAEVLVATDPTTPMWLCLRLPGDDRNAGQRIVVDVERKANRLTPEQTGALRSSLSV